LTRGKDNKNMMEHLVLVTQIGLTMAGSILFCFAVGFYLDRWLGTKGIFLVIFTILGVIGGGWTVFRQISDLDRDKNRNDHPERNLRKK